MEKLNLSEIRIEFLEEPTRNFNHDNGNLWYDYDISAFIDKTKLGHITISRRTGIARDKKPDDFWFNLNFDPPIMRPVVVYQDTFEKYRGRGVSGRILVLANEKAKKIFDEPLASDTLFSQNQARNFAGKNYHPYPGMRVWQKLDKEELAYFRPFNDKPRWIMY